MSLTLHTDKYQINMMYAHWKNGTADNGAVFEAYFRKLPFGNGYAVFAGLERILDYIHQLRFGEQELRYLSEQEENYDPAFLERLREFRFNGTLYAMEEGAIVFPNEPLIRVEGTIFEAQLVETAILNFLNYQTLIATKASRIVQVAAGDILLEFGTRRAQEADAAVWGARAAYIAGFHATSNLHAGMLFGIPTKGTHAHAWVQAHDSEEEAFLNYAKAMPEQVTLLIDTYDTLNSGLENAIKTARWLESIGKQMSAIRLDSGDLAYLSKEARKRLDAAGLPYVKIVASNDLDETLIFNLKVQGAKIDTWGVGTQLITAADQPSLGGVYKLTARERDGQWQPVIKLSNNPEKVSTPGRKEPYRIIDRRTGLAEADYIALTEEDNMRRVEPLRLFDPIHPYISRVVSDYEAVPLLVRIIDQGKTVYKLPSLEQIRSFHLEELSRFRPEVQRKLNPELHPVHLSEKLWQLKMDLIKHSKR
ncbi:nicotinate phosphoribosyltransferase [Paenibacillus sp. NEAU-GSW1]|uniref:nicotinate phosphoribosyltransferase n=1 Tax=Paenibacillus sp. NEAU-GSW1 TaxID=2682486 RepID=UPI0012E283DA|nr:nicotinate phosphoribosyltransferase [Paenibacillus sp. NEAU-GSW1]MUT66084.1 nicotinate phosphoribosyltransferase [Paenibacillus sp. NEAU-GSW1]